MREWAEEHKTMVLLGVDGEDDLYRWGDRCFYEGVPYMTFIEPDIGDQMTAIAFYPGNKFHKDLRSQKLLDFRQRDVSSAVGTEKPIGGSR